MARRRSATIQDLRRAIDCLPTHTKVAMLDGIRSDEIIVGAYSKDGGICPMLAAHRRGGRTSFIAFAKAWDAFAFRGARKRVARRATRRELLVLSSHLEASLLTAEKAPPELSTAIAEHRELAARRPPRRERHGEHWLRIFRRYDDYRRALDLLDATPQDAVSEPELERVS
jgi:hypothetical protein